MAYKKSNLQQICISHNVLPSNSSKPRIHSKSKEVRFDTSSAIHLHRDGISDNIVRVTADHIESLLLTIKLFLTQTQFSALTFLSHLGKLSAAADFVLLGRLHLRPLICLETSYSSSRLSSFINSMIRFHLKLWLDTKPFVQGTSIHPPDPNAFLFTDASHYGWGAHRTDETILSWSLDGRRISAPYQYSGNMAICFALKKAIQYIHHSCVMISTDSTKVVSYINKQGGTHSPDLCKLSTCICISTNNSNTVCSSQDTSISVQNSFYCSSLASVSLVLRGVTTTNISSDLSSVPSKKY